MPMKKACTRFFGGLLFACTKMAKPVAMPVAKPEVKRPAALAAVGDTIFISVMKPAAKWS